MESDDDFQSDVESTTSEDTALYEEDEEPDFTPTPTIVEAGDSVEGVFKIMSHKLDPYNIPCKTGYIEVLHAQRFKQWWTQKVKSALLRDTNWHKPKKNQTKSVYEWKYRLQCSSDRDPGRWQLVILAKEKELETMWCDERQIAEIKIQLDWRAPYKRRMMIFVYLKSDAFSSLYQHYADQCYLTQDEYNSLQLEDD